MRKFIIIVIITFLILVSCAKKEKEITVIYFAGLPMGQLMKEMIPEFTQETDIKTGKDMKADEYICKPFDQDELIKSIKKHLKE